jgi:hypothetical protein
MGTERISTVIGAVVLAIAAMVGASAAQTCDDIFADPTKAPSISEAYNKAFEAQGASGRKTIKLGDTVTIKGDNLTRMFTGACENRTVVLYLDGWQMKGLTRAPQSDPNEGAVHFTLKRTSDATEAWTRILGSPLSQDGEVEVSMGFENGFALKSTKPDETEMTFTIVPMDRFVLWLLLFVLLAGVFLYFACYTNIIRDPGPVVTQSHGLFSLSRMQGHGGSS